MKKKLPLSFLIEDHVRIEKNWRPRAHKSILPSGRQPEKNNCCIKRGKKQKPVGRSFHCLFNPVKSYFEKEKFVELTLFRSFSCFFF